MRLELPSATDIPEWAAFALSLADTVQLHWAAAALWIVLLGSRVALRIQADRRRRSRIRDGRSRVDQTHGEGDRQRMSFCG